MKKFGKKRTVFYNTPFAWYVNKKRSEWDKIMQCIKPSCQLLAWHAMIEALVIQTVAVRCDVFQKAEPAQRKIRTLSCAAKSGADKILAANSRRS
jgi:hypothetical protein